MPADAGIRFGQYVLVRRIARGGMAEVFLAQQRGLEGFDRRVAVKRILPHLADSPDFVKMFLGEAKLAAQLSHPNIVHIYEFGKVEHDYFIAMEFVDGVHAGQLFKHGEKEKERLSPTLIARIGADAANALHYAHELRAPNGKLYGLVHRDVSPANIMVSFDGVVKLCDFGIAKAAAAGDQLTNPGQVKGKYAYMSPEQTIASQLDGRSDVFSLAIVLWELLTGKFIVPRGDAVAAMRAIRDGKLEPIEKAAPGTPAPLVKAITWALEPKREKRATAADLAQALEAFIKSSPELATSMQLGGWVRGRFPRDGTGQVPALSPGTGAQQSPGTQASPGTFAAPGTASGPSATPPPDVIDTPVSNAPTQLPPTPAMYPPRRVVKLMSDTGEGTEIYSTSDLEDSMTIKGPRPRPPFATPSSAATVIDPRGAKPGTGDEPTVHGDPPIHVGDETEVVDARHYPQAPDEEDSLQNALETVLRDRRTPIPSGPISVPTRTESAMPPPAPLSPSGAQRPPSTPQGGINMASLSRDSRMPHTLKGTGDNKVLPRRGSQPSMDPRRATTMSLEEARALRRRKMILMGAGLGGLMLLSFMIALAASNQGPADKKAAPPQDSAVIALRTTDAALPLAPPPVDAAPEPTIPVDAAPAAAYLVVRTIPDGGTIKVGDQTRNTTVQPGDPTGAATAQLVLEAGRHTVHAELDGYQDEKRDVILDPGENKTIEITFTKKLSSGRPERGPSMGRLSVRTTPWSDVYLGQKKLGQAPFADLELPVGTHTLTFKNPSRPTVTRTVTIKANKLTKLNFSL